MPGMKDYISIKRNVHQQKRLMCNLKELFKAFKEQNPTIALGFSKFCSLRPKWCIIAGSSGTHAVCVCTIHQNMKLLLAPMNITYKDLMKYIVCDTSRRDCMIHRCPNCPKSLKPLEEFLYDTLEEFEDAEVIEFSQWTTTDRSTLTTQKESYPAYIDLVGSKLNKLAPHSYIAKAQSRYLKQRKEELGNNDVLFLGDFAENYKFIVQDEVQSFHWSNLQCTLHPVVIYYKDAGAVQHKSFCIISSDNTHDVAFVYMVQKKIIHRIKATMPNILKIEYFSDGCAGQYKNYKNFVNLCNHQKDFGFSAKWNFFATSHGKQPCDGIGGTVKRMVAKESLQRTTDQQILSTESMYEFCNSFVQGVNFILIEKEEIDKERRSLTKRFKDATTIPGTRSFHHFNPLGGSRIAMKRCSEDENYDLIYNFSAGAETKIVQCVVSGYVCCKCDNKFWIGIVLEIDTENDDLLIKFMHPALPSHSFYWDQDFEDTCLVPSTNILFTVEVPTTPNGRVYHLSKADTISVQKAIYAKTF